MIYMLRFLFRFAFFCCCFRFVSFVVLLLNGSVFGWKQAAKNMKARATVGKKVRTHTKTERKGFDLFCIYVENVWNEIKCVGIETHMPCAARLERVWNWLLWENSNSCHFVRIKKLAAGTYDNAEKAFTNSRSIRTQYRTQQNLLWYAGLIVMQSQTKFGLFVRFWASARTWLQKW